MKNISIDIETYSGVNLAKCGSYKYAESDDFEILLFGYSVDGAPVTVIDLTAGESIPDNILAALTDESVTKWSFNRRDVESEMAIQKRLSRYPVPEKVWDEYHLDQEINAAEPAPDVNAVLQMRQQLAKSSVKKYQAMQTSACADSRAHGMFQFYGANRSGRWAGRLIQLQNLPQNHMSDLAEARELVRTGDFETLRLLYDDIPDMLSQLIRTAFIPRPGYKFIVSDFSAIEACVLSWLSGEECRSKVFAENGDIYCASASAMFGVPVEKHGVNSHLRQKGKIAELALGYGGSVGALKSMGALDMGLADIFNYFVD